MVHLLGASILMVFSIHFFSINYTFSKINNAYYGLYKGVVESAVIISDEEGNELSEPVFSSTLVKEKVNAYFTATVKPYCPYRLQYYFLNKAGRPVSDRSWKTIISITFLPKAWHSYLRTASFQITKGINNNG